MALVLIVDDEPVNRALVASLLHYGGHATLEAGDGEAALALARERRPDLVICDILMPVMDGYEFVRALRADPALAATQVIFYSATFLNEQAQELAARCGVAEVLIKPCEPQDILAAIGRVLAQPRPPPTMPEAPLEFDRRHLRLVTDKLLAKVEELEAVNHRLAALVDSAMDAIVGLDASLSVVLFNPAAEAMFGWRADELVGQPLERLLPSLAGASEAALLGEVARGRVPQARVLEGVRRGGTAFPIEATVARTGEDGMRYCAILRDVTERRAAEERVRRFARVATVLSDINSLIVRARQRDELFHETCRIAVEVGRFLRAWIALAEPPAGDPVRIHLTALCGQGGAYEEDLRAALEDERGVHPQFAEALRSGAVVTLNDLAHDDTDWPLREAALASGVRAIAWLPLHGKAGPIGVLALHADTAGFFDEQELRLLRELAGDMSFALEHLEQQEHLERLAFYDPLTGLANETLLRERLAQQLAEAALQQRRVVLVLVDLVHFKRINDTLGRRSGDRLLCQVAERLGGCLDGRSRLARVVADRFAVLLTDPPDPLAAHLATHHRACFGAPFTVDGEPVRVDARLGVAVFPQDGADTEALIRHAEVALKTAKGGAEPVVLYEPRMSALVAETLALENQLRRAVEREEFVLHYQPKVDVDTRRLTGLEALLRWRSPERGLVEPTAFVGLLEETGLIVPVGLWAVRRAAQDHRRWRERFGEAPSIAVNVSAVQLRREHFVDEVLHVLQGEGAEPGAIDLEVTESLLMQDVEAAIGKLHALHAHQVSIAIDDFGTGYSSLAYLSKLPAHVLKIDRSFIAAMMTDADSMTLVSTMISLAHSLRMHVVAEGVETEEQAKILRLLRCDQMQGFLVSRPLPQGEIEHRLCPGH